jgi:hypothetical protein
MSTEPFQFKRLCLAAGKFPWPQIKAAWVVILALLSGALGARAQTGSNCCANCVAPYPLSYTNQALAGDTFLANNLCQGTNDTLADLLPVVPDGTEVLIWDYVSQSFVAAQYFAGFGWADPNTGNPVNFTIAPGEGFVVNNPNGPFPLVISGCQPTCPPPCSPPTNGYVLVGRLGIGTATYADLFSCPPACGTRVQIFNGSAYINYDYVNGAWTPSPPVLQIGQSAFVSVLSNSNCCPTQTNLVLNTGLDRPSNTVYAYGQADAFWWVTKDPTVPAAALPRPATVIQRNAAWQPPLPNSQWISSYPTEVNNLNGEYDFQTYFCTAPDATNLVLNICLRADDAAAAALNGNLIPLSGSTVFKAPNPACGTVSQAINPSWFVLGGQNVLTLYVTNIYAVAMGLNASVSVTGSGLISLGESCCQFGSGISGQKFYDLNCNGVQDPGEPSLSGWTIHLSNGSNTVTDVNGYYYFTNLPPGTYTVTEVQQPGWTQSAPSGGSHTVTLGTLQEVNGQDFGNCHSNTPGCVQIVCPSNIVAQCAGNGAIVAFNVTAFSQCDPGAPVQVTCVPPSTTLFPVGTTVVNCTAVDSQYNWATCSFTVTVLPGLGVICSSNKTVPCGSAWSFDPPTAAPCCTNMIVTSTGVVTNVLITSLGIVSNGVCPQQITQAWLITDGCGDTNVCSQTVTVVSCVPAPSGLVLWLPFDELSGNNTANLYAGGNNGALVGGPTHNLGSYVLNSLCFNGNAGVDEYVSVPDYAAIDPAVGQGFTLDAWVQRALGAPNTPTCVALDKRDPNTGNGYSLSVDYGHVILTLSGSNYADATDVIPADGQWHFVAVSVSFGTTSPGEFYVDGNPAVSFFPAPATLATTVPLTVGKSVLDDHVANQPWEGCIDEVEMFNRALSAGEIAAIYNAGAAGKCKTPKLACVSDKSVACGSQWSFDPPSVNDPCCGSNRAAVPYGGDINGGTLCTPTVTRTWLYVDCCGLSHFCSQTVTVVNSNTACTPLLARAGLTNITVWEQTGSSVPHLFGASPSNPALQPIAGGPTPTAFDFSTTSKEFYDVYVSDPDGTPDINGCCITVVCDYTGTGVNGGVGGNIDAVELNFSSGATIGASSVGSVVLGGGITDPTLLASSGLATNALGLHDSNSTRLGQGLGRITVCFPADCSSAKTVQCGSQWSFNPPPPYTACCGSNVTVTVLNTVTNGTACDLVITRTWEVIDCCTNKSTCSQTVTVVDTTPPSINCLTNTLVVALNTNCQLVIPKVKAIASDNCTPASQLQFSQSPTNGTIVSSHSQLVTVTVTDLCGNSNHCTTLVVGVDKTPPVVTCPASITVTNCLVPCVRQYVSATDNCCPASSLIFSQSPPCNTPLGPGINSVTVTVTDCHGNTTIKTIHLNIVGGTESFLANLFNTGVDASPSLLVDDAVDPHYALPPANVPVGLPADYHGNAVAVSPICHAIGSPLNCAYQKFPGCYVYTPWDLTSPVSKWIGPNYTNNGCDLAGTYTYVLNFTLPAGLNPATATISGRWAADNAAGMHLNAAVVPAVDGGVTTGFTAWTPFTIPAGSGFVPGANTLTFIVTNYETWTGLRVEFTNAYANCFTCAPPAILSITPSESLQEFSAATFHVTASGTPPLSYQWYLNGTPLSNSGHDSGVTTPTLHVAPLYFSDAGLYTVVVCNQCGCATNHVRLAVTWPWWWTWGWWNVADLANPLAATAGPDLNLVGSSFGTSYGISAGTTEDFGLPNPGGQAANVMHVALPADTSLQVPPIAPSGSNSLNSYSLLLDLYVPSTSSGSSSTLFINPGSAGATDQTALAINAAGLLELSGAAAGSPFDLVSTMPFQFDAWNRVGLVIGNPADAGAAGNPTADLYLNGQPAGSTILPAAGAPIDGVTINWSNSAPTLLSRQTNDTGDVEYFVSSIQFHAVALTAGQLAGIGGPDTGPAPGNDTAVGPQPVVSVAQSGGLITLTWLGSPFELQETDDIGSGVWMESGLPFSETQVNGNVQTTATAKPAPQAPAKFYRLVFRP